MGDDIPSVDLSPPIYGSRETLPDKVRLGQRQNAVRWWAGENMERLATVPWNAGDWVEVYDHFAPEKGRKARFTAYILVEAQVPIGTPLDITSPEYASQLPKNIDFEKVQKFFGPVAWYLGFKDAELYGPLKDVPRLDKRDPTDPSEQDTGAPFDSRSSV
ncbi:hypothetical protein C8Q79DRAFT_923204 [Trametes meyenii]|nr:hypothetical protein C8Q79DRAFT_923204 [Trametes meyenii]